jgi:hypothetical protein
LSSRSRIVAWQRHVTARLTVACGGPGRRFEFRGAVRRRIPFTQLGTPPLAAVLGLERYGSYCLALGDLDHPIAETDGSGIRGEPAASAIACLALRLYGEFSHGLPSVTRFGGALCCLSVGGCSDPSR